MTGRTGTTALQPPVGMRDHTQGPETAPVTLVEYGDYECAACCEAHVFVQKARQRLGNRLRFVFRHFITAERPPRSPHAARAAEAAGAQDRFWEMHGSLFAHEGALDNGHIVEYADALGLDIPRFLRDMADHAPTGRVCEDLEGGLHSGVSATPTFFINGVRYDHHWNAQALLAAIEDEEAAAAAPQDSHR